MPSLTPSLRKVGRLVAGQLGRLHATLERLSQEIRAAIARAIGQATGETVREALGVILDGPTGRPTYDRLDDRDDGWGQTRRPSWPATRTYDSYSRDPYERDPDDGFDEDRRRQDADDEDDPPADQSIDAPRRRNWSRAVATGCQAAAWWLRRHQGPFSLVAAAGIGIAAGFAMFVSGPLVSGASAVAASALGLLALADAARSAADLADQVMK
jgi:hypothetical protein